MRWIGWEENYSRLLQSTPEKMLQGWGRKEEEKSGSTGHGGRHNFPYFFWNFFECSLFRSPKVEASMRLSRCWACSRSRFGSIFARTCGNLMQRGAGHPPPPTQVLGGASLLSGTAPLARSSSGTASTPEDTEPREAKLADNVKACEVVVSMERAPCDYVQRGCCASSKHA